MSLIKMIKVIAADQRTFVRQRLLSPCKNWITYVQRIICDKLRNLNKNPHTYAAARLKNKHVYSNGPLQTFKGYTVDPPWIKNENVNFFKTIIMSTFLFALTMFEHNQTNHKFVDTSVYYLEDFRSLYPNYMSKTQ